jgi:hypothetical protein
MSESNKALVSLAGETVAILSGLAKLTKAYSKTRDDIAFVWMTAYSAVISGIYTGGFYRAPGQRSKQAVSFFEAMGGKDGCPVSQAKAERLWNYSQAALAEPAFEHKVKGETVSDSLSGLREAAKSGPEAVQTFLAEKGIKSEAALKAAVQPPKKTGVAEMIANFLAAKAPEERKAILSQVSVLLTQYDAKRAAKLAAEAEKEREKAAEKAAAAVAASHPPTAVIEHAVAETTVRKTRKGNGVDATGRNA